MELGESWIVGLIEGGGEGNPKRLGVAASPAFSSRSNILTIRDSLARYGASINVNDKTLELTKDNDKSWKANFTFQRVSESQLTLDGNMDSHKVHMQLQLVDRKTFLLVNRGFHWVQEYPFNR